jgi:ribonuclease E
MYNVVEEYDIEEEDYVEEKLVHVLEEDVVEVQGDVLDNVLDENDIDGVLDEEIEEFEPNVGDNVPDHDIDDDMIGNDDIDDDVDMVNSYNINYESDDTDVELNEEED